MSTAPFNPDRSAAIRQLLLDTVADAPRRERRTRFTIIGALTGVALALAGGTAALALTGVLKLAAPDSAPAPVPSPTVTVTPTPTPTPSGPRADAHPFHVQSTGIPLRDVTTAPGAPSWSLDLPGTGESCEQQWVYDIAAGYALFQIGSNVMGDSGDCSLPSDHLSLTMVDTYSGSPLWQREWNWTTETGGVAAEVTVLGTTGRALVSTHAAVDGPHEVIDLATGRTLADADLHRTEGGEAPTLEAVGGDSGDVIVAYPADPDAGHPVARVERADPRDLAHPVWSTALDAKWAHLGPGSASSGAIPVYWSTDDGTVWSVVNVSSGAVTPVGSNAGFIGTRDAMVFVTRSLDGRQRLAGVGPSGAELWSVELQAEEDAREISALFGTAGSGRLGTNLLAVFGGQRLSVVDATTGDTRWRADVGGCSSGAQQGFQGAFLDEKLNTVILDFGAGRTCSLDADTGAPRPIPDTPSADGTTWALHGSAIDYVVPSMTGPGVLRAYDRATGEQLWELPTAENDRWLFAGGVLMRQNGTHIEPVG